MKYNGVSISYNAIGNPTSDGTWTYTWEKGRQLKQMTKSGTTATFAYNADGLRIRKTVGSTVTNYTLHGKNIVHMTQGSNTLHFWYDASNKPAIVQFNGTKYAYLHNLQGDIVGIVDSSGSEVVKYIYDPWGKILSTSGSLASTLGTIQPFRYRGYVYDEETGLYYLRSRYYCCDICRFINSDKYYSISNTLFGHNIFTYCHNKPIILSDTEGQFPFLAAAVFIGVSTLLGAAGAAFVAWVDGKSGEEIAQAAWEGAATGLVAATIGVFGVSTGLGSFGGALLGAGLGATIDIGFQAYEQMDSTGSFSFDDVDWARVGETAVTTALSAAVPIIDNALDDAAYVAGSILLCAEATTAISVGVIIYHKIKDTDQKQFKSIYAD